MDTEIKMNAKMSTFLTDKCKKITRKFYNKGSYNAFKNRVEKSIAPDYYDVIKEPMYLSEVLRKLKNNLYSELSQYVHDMNLIWSNAIIYNGENSYFGILAQCCEYKFKKELEKLSTTKQDEHIYKLKKYSEQISFWAQYLQKELDHVPTKYDGKV